MVLAAGGRGCMVIAVVWRYVAFVVVFKRPTSSRIDGESYFERKRLSFGSLDSFGAKVP